MKRKKLGKKEIQTIKFSEKKHKKLNVIAKACAKREYVIAKKISAIKENIALNWKKRHW